MNNKSKLLTLCSAAVVAATSVGIVHAAQSASNSMALSTPTVATAKATTKAKSTSKKTTTTKKATAKKATTKKKTTVKQKYKDGTYSGVGQTRIGAVQVAVTLKKDKITKVQITGYSTHYPISYINPILPQELLKTQNINKIDVVSGATLSTEDFYYAVQEALSRAQAAEKKA